MIDETFREAIMWAAPGDGLGLKTLWTEAPDAMERLDALYKSRRIRKAERDELAHFIDHGWLVWRGAIEPDLIDRFVADIRSYYTHPGMFLTTNHRHGSSNRKISGDTPTGSRACSTSTSIWPRRATSACTGGSRAS